MTRSEREEILLLLRDAGPSCDFGLGWLFDLLTARPCNRKAGS